MKKQWISSILAAAAMAGCVAEVDDLESSTGDTEVGRQAQAIYHGRESSPHSQPWMVDIQIDEKHHCGGSIIHPLWILTAAHCLEDLHAPFADVRVLAGEHDFTVHESAEEPVPVAKVFKHPDFTHGSQNYDVGLIQLSKPLTIREAAQTVALPSTGVPSSLLVTGWGVTDLDDTADFLSEADIKRLESSECSIFGIKALEFCAGAWHLLRGGVASCDGDSGGPALNVGLSRREVHGIVSRGGCGSGKAVFTQVRSFVPWIKSTINNTPLRGNYRFVWTGNRSGGGSLELLCNSTGEKRRAPTWIRGVEIALDCPASSRVTATCRAGESEEIVSFRRRLNNGEWTTVGSGGASHSNFYNTLNATDVIDWECNFTD